MPDHVTPTDQRLAVTAAVAAEDDSPVVMLNLNRYRDRAAYPRGRPTPTSAGARRTCGTARSPTPRSCPWAARSSGRPTRPRR